MRVLKELRREELSGALTAYRKAQDGSLKKIVWKTDSETGKQQYYTAAKGTEDDVKEKILKQYPKLKADSIVFQENKKFRESEEYSDFFKFLDNTFIGYDGTFSDLKKDAFSIALDYFELNVNEARRATQAWVQARSRQLNESESDFDYAIYKTDGFVKSLLKRVDKNTIRMAFETVLGD